MHIPYNKRVVNFLLTSEHSAELIAVAKPKLPKYVLFFESMSGAPVLALKRVQPSWNVLQVKEQFCKRFSRISKSTVRHHSFLRFFSGSTELKDHKPLSAQGYAKSRGRITVIFAAENRQVLETLYDLTEGEYWGKGSKHRIGWRKPSRISTWAGVSTDPSGEYVVSLYKSCRLKGEMLAVCVHSWDGMGA